MNISSQVHFSTCLKTNALSIKRSMGIEGGRFSYAAELTDFGCCRGYKTPKRIHFGTQCSWWFSQQSSFFECVENENELKGIQPERKKSDRYGVDPWIKKRRMEKRIIQSDAASEGGLGGCQERMYAPSAGGAVGEKANKGALNAISDVWRGE